jgi:putative membrane protein
MKKNNQSKQGNKIKILAAIIFALSFGPVNSIQAVEMRQNMISDAGIISLLMTIDKSEVDAGKKAKTKKLSKEVSDYANMMVQAHGANLQKDKNLGKSLRAPKWTGYSAKVHKEDAAHLKKILKMSGMDFEKAYMDMMIAGHTSVLAKLEKQLIPSAQNSALKTHLENTQKAVTSHLEMAKNIRQNLK